MAESTTVTVRLNLKLKKRLEKVAIFTKRSKSFLAAEAIENLVELNEWQMKEIKKGVQEAEMKDFASPRRVKAVFDKWSDSGRR